MSLGVQELAVVFAEFFLAFLFSYSDPLRNHLPCLQGSPDHEDTTRSSPVSGAGYLKETGEVACILSVLTILKNTCRTNCCSEPLCTLAKEVRQCANCKVLSFVYGVLQNTKTIHVRV